MKITDGYLREIASNKNDDGAPVCSELLQRRREVRRLRKALRKIAERGVHPTDIETAKAAIKPQRGAK